MDVDGLRIGVYDEEKRKWWNWGSYLDTWRMIDENPKLPIEELPLYAVFKRVLERREDDSLPTDWILNTIELYESIKTRGYIQGEGKSIVVDIKDNGVIHVHNGHRRVSILKHLGSPRHIEVVVRSRSKSWMDIKETAFSFYDRKLLYQPIDHPDFVGWEVDRPCMDRLKSILDFIGTVKGKRILDVGSCTGYLSQRLAEMGATVVGVDINEKRVKIAKALSKYHGLPESNPAFHVMRFEDYLEDAGSFDCILFLSLLQHYLRRNVRGAWNALTLVSSHTDLMFFDIGEKRLPINWSPQRVLNHSKFTKFVKLDGDVRPLYAFTKGDKND